MLTTSLSNVLSGVGVIASFVWIITFVQAFAGRRHVLKLRDLTTDEPEDGWPSISVIVAARDEEAMIEACLRSLLAQDYPALEVIAVDDRSADQTGTILDNLAREDHRLQAVHLNDLPAGWLGKTHAMQKGAEASIARWLLFTDADVIFAPDALRRAIGLAEGDNLDHLTAVPEFLTDSIGERLFMSLFSLMFALKAPHRRVENRNNQASIGAGAFNLVRAEVFETVGGFKRIALSIDEDLRLGQTIKYAGYRNKYVIGTGIIAVRWHQGLRGIIRGVEKNFFAVLDFRLDMLALATGFILVLTLGPTLGLINGPVWGRVVCGLGVASTACLLALVDITGRNGWIYALALPISGPVMAYALLRSAWIALRHKGVAWRGRLYPLSELKAHVKLRNYWFHEVWHSTR